MKILKIVLISLAAVLVLALLTAAILPKKFVSERAVIVERPGTEVYNYIRYLKNQDNFGVWYRVDPKMQRSYSGTDGEVGFTTTWKSDMVGGGSQEITKIEEGKAMESRLFFDGFDDPAYCRISVEEKDRNTSEVKWSISGTTPWPFNLMSLFYDIGDDFESGLINLKEILEKQG